MKIVIYEQEAVKRIFNEYDKDRTKARVARDLRVKEIKEKFPRLDEIEKEITNLGIKNFKNILENPQNSEKFNAEFQKNLQKLNLEREKFLNDNNIPSDFDEVKYKCEKCLDTGYIDNEKCPCLIQKMIDIHYEMSNMKSMLHDFSEFSLEFYGDKRIESLNMTEKENMEDILKRALAFCEKDDAKNLLFYGGCGLGKTFLSSCIAKKMLDNGKSVIYETATSLFSDYEDYKFGRKDGDFEEISDILYNADLLIVDDLGTEVSNPISAQFFLDIISNRIINNKKIIISTNLTMEGIRKKYTERLFSRIYEGFEILGFVGNDIRIQKLVNGRRKNG